MTSAPAPASALQVLARRCGIADEYLDVWDKPHATSDDTRLALLAAMQLPVHDADPAAILLALEEADWRRPLPPLLVAKVDTAIAVDIGVPSRTARQRWRWRLQLEAGGELGGEFQPARLPRLTAPDILAGKPGGRGYHRHRLELPGVAATGYHSLHIEAPDLPPATMPLIVTPGLCYEPEAVKHGGRVWGPCVQLYGLRSRRNWGMGDFSDLKHLVGLSADAGGGIVGINPLHALFPDNPEHISPYSPSSRSAMNALYLDVEAVPEFAECAEVRELVAAPAFQAELRALRAEPLVNHPGVAAVKRDVLARLYRHFRERHLEPGTPHARGFLEFRRQAGQPLERLALYDTLQAHFRAADPATWGWPVWPEAYRDPAAAAVAEFAAEHRVEVDFHAWLQWQADLQLAAVGQESWRRGLGIGLYGDLAVGANPCGAEVWSWQQVFARGAYAGAPPEEINLNGQDWGLPPLIPRRLREAAYGPLIDILRANMRHAGALRIDHAMALTRVFWVPAGRLPTEGTYVTYPIDELLGIVALESQRNRCLVVGEDLGTVPDGFRERLRQAHLLSYRPFILDRQEDGSFSRPADYPPGAVASFSTHDMPTLPGFWLGTDLDARTELAMFPSEQLRETMVIGRAQDRARLLLALEREQLLPAGASPHPVSVPEMSPPFVRSMYAFLARTASVILAVQAEDMLGIREQANLPGSLDHQHPNWRRRLTLDLEDWPSDENCLALVEVLRRDRGSAVFPHPEIPASPRQAIIPRATYRLQFNRDFSFAQATALVPYLAALGISHCYASPYLKARPGSGHGYDIVDHGALNPEIGSTEDYERFIAALRDHGMGHILDVVPNHMGVMGADNAWWLDVLENGQAAAHAGYFDIDWEPPNSEQRGRILLPLLADHYGAVLERGELRLQFDREHGEFSLTYWQHRLPIDPAAYPRIVEPHLERLALLQAESGETCSELQTLMGAFSRLPTRCERDAAAVAARRRDKEVFKRQLAGLCAASPAILNHIETNVAELNGHPGDGASYDGLHALIQAQAYRLAYWRVASDEINYRRFFDINDLAALRMEDPGVFADTHRFVLGLLAEGKVEGLRIDHPDGLYDPGAYFRRLQEAAAGRALGCDDPLPLYLVIEKILADHEQLPADWPIHGATGYRFANLANALFVDTASERRLTRIYNDFIGGGEEFDALVHRAKRLIMGTSLSSELNVLANRLARIAALDRHTCDYTLSGLRKALAEVVACFPVYRTYVGPAGASGDDRRHIAWAVGIAKKRSPAADIGILDFVESVLTTDIAAGHDEDYRAAVTAFAMKFQQFSAPVMAKGLEDTSFYRHHRLVSLNDVGGEPRRFGVSVAAYHAATRARAQRWPHNLLATSTHDSKRSEDVRARIDVLSEIPAEWKLMLRRWSRLNRSRLRQVDGRPAPSPKDEYLIYQTLIGTWPLGEPGPAEIDAYRERLAGYLVKAVREAKEHSSWINVNADYEAALADFLAALLAPGERNPFIADFLPAVRRVSHHGLLNSLSLTLLKLTSPGVADIYQGSELWQFHLVDPDNRRPVDYELRSRLLAELAQLDDAPASALAPLLADMSDGRVKLHLIRRTLQLRRQWPEVFQDGDYQPLAIRGVKSAHVCAFARRQGERTLIALVPRLTVKLLGAQIQPLGASVWGDTGIELPRRLRHTGWENILTGETFAAGPALPLATLLGAFPVALLASR